MPWDLVGVMAKIAQKQDVRLQWIQNSRQALVSPVSTAARTTRAAIGGTLAQWMAIRCPIECKSATAHRVRTSTAEDCLYNSALPTSGCNKAALRIFGSSILRPKRWWDAIRLAESSRIRIGSTLWGRMPQTVRPRRCTAAPLHPFHPKHAGEGLLRTLPMSS